MRVSIVVGDTTVCGPSGVGDADGMSEHWAGGIADHLDGIEFVIGTGFFDDCLL